MADRESLSGAAQAGVPATDDGLAGDGRPRAVVCEYHRYDSVMRVGSHHVAQALLRRGYRVTWLAHATSWLHRLRGPRPPEIVRHEDGVVELTLRTLAPYIELPGLGSLWWGRRWLASSARAKEALERSGLGKVDLLWLSDFTMLPVIDLIDAEHVVYRFFDHIELFRRMPRTIFELVDAYRDRAELIVASSRGVQESLARRGIEAEYLPNGADPESFVPGLPERERRPRKVVYVGMLEEWFDLEAVEYWARNLPEVSFELAGPNRLGRGSTLPNVRFNGPVHFRELPSLLTGAAVGLIPFRMTELTSGVHPLKLYDYLAAGCPVLSSDLPEVPCDPRGIMKYRNPEEGLEQLRGLLDRPAECVHLQELAARHDWQARLDPVFARLGLDANAGSAAR